MSVWEECCQQPGSSYTEIVKYLPVLNSGRSLQKHLVQTWMRAEGKRGKEKRRQGEEWRSEKEEEEEEGRREGGVEGIDPFT